MSLLPRARWLIQGNKPSGISSPWWMKIRGDDIKPIIFLAHFHFSWVIWITIQGESEGDHRIHFHVVLNEWYCLWAKPRCFWCNCFFTALMISNMMFLYYEKRTKFTTQSCTRLKIRKLSWRGKCPIIRLHCLHSTCSLKLLKYL